ncbi:SDR family NAD(P)-dependent oxidoreductase [Actinoallomurus iriomotensis]|uniref:Short-chain dehydrogenase n=1 Tax=Actinoallomurus iriomotensis TaxID=478107 RepID=A0A9W6RN71_9ACTN|nr:SDR family NAD(P)-dependent oxidoreductase [Actinoallomurus iriomotensis]GLY78976.1 short-chain dehydrogenase [Actinoallomurus iriomotensis]
MSGRTAIVSGGASGIGAATAELFGAQGWDVVVADLRVADGETRDASGAVRLSVRTDVTDDAALERLAQRTRDRFGRVDAVVTCAGTADNAAVRDVTPARFTRTLTLNLVATFALCRLFVDDLAATRGSIVTVASVSGLRGSPDRAAYSASKGGVIALTRQLAVELATEAVRVNCVAPGSTLTPLVETAQGGERTRRAILEAIPLRRYAEPREIAQVITFLAGEGAGFVTGQVWGVDGGQLAGAGWNRPEAAR